MRSSRSSARYSDGPFYRADEIRSGDPYELSEGRAIHCLPTGARGSRANLFGATVLDTDPAVEEAGVDTGFSPDSDTLRAPDVAIGHVPDEPGWVPGVPPLAVEFADKGQDETELQNKIRELLAKGTRLVWVVRMVGLRRVEIYEPGQSMRMAHADEELLAPGILKNPVPVATLYDREAAHEATLRNLLQRKGYANLDAVRDEGIEKGRLEEARSALRRVLQRRGIAPNRELDARIQAMNKLEILERWLDQAITASSAREALE